MSDSRDPAIKLFGTTIPLPDISSPAAAEAGEVEVIAGEQSDGGDEEERPSPSANAVADGEKCSGGGEERESDKDQMDGDGIETRPESESLSHSSDKSTNRDATEGANENQNTSSSGADESTASKPSKIEEEKSETNTSQEGTPKKPDKILPCPRCNSMDTKFCYYNNYNVNQPRHFCKNCQRYWTAGGTMRNVPVGAGRRKNKNSMAHYRPITIPEVVHSARSEFPNGLHPALTTNASVVALGPDSPLCESMASVLNIAEKTMVNCTQTGLQNPELKVSDPFSRDDQLSGSSSKVDGTISGSKDPVPLVFPTLPSQTPCFPEASWPYTFLPPTFYPNTFAMPFYPTAPYWPCAVPSTWSIPWVSLPSPSNGHMSAGSGPNSPTLGKHSREESMIKSSASNENDPEKDGNSEKCLWIPKTLRINDPEEAAKSSIWTTLGIKNDDVAGAIPGNGIFKAFQSKAEVNKNHDISTSSVLQANPAALSRSQNFHESS